MTDITLVPFSDMHTCSTTALFPNVYHFLGEWRPLTEMGGWPFKHQFYYPTSRQVKMWEHLNICLDQIAVERTEKIVLLEMGDSIEGVHHGTNEVATRIPEEQISAHVELMKYIKEKIGFRAEDEMYMVTGTEAHVNDTEDEIGRQLNATRMSLSRFSSEFLKLQINGKWIWCTHHGPPAGKGANRGNPMRNWLKTIFFDCMREGITPPDMVLSGHTHDPDYNTFVYDHHTVHGVILPSWQWKTRYAWKVAPASIGKIGMYKIVIPERGHIFVEQPWILADKDNGDIVKIA